MTHLMTELDFYQRIGAISQRVATRTAYKSSSQILLSGNIPIYMIYWGFLYKDL